MIGKDVARIDALEKATGEAKFTVDLKLPGMLHGKILRSSYAHAKIVSLDVSKAAKLPGVRAVITGRDVPQYRFGIVLRDRPVLAVDRVRFVGEPVAAVAADSLEIAEEAVGLIEVQYEELPAILDAEQALDATPPTVIHPEFADYEGAVTRSPDAPPNVHSTFRIRKGNVEKGFEEADIIVENKFRTARVQHCALEPHAALATVRHDGSLTIWTSSQGPHHCRYQLSRFLGIPLTKVRVIVPYVGGGFGSKIAPNVEFMAALLAIRTRRPVKIVFTREEVFLDGTVRMPVVVYIKDGVKKSGEIVAREMKVILDGGAYGAISSLLTYVPSHGAVGTYQIPNFSWDSYGVYTNLPPAGTFRGVANPTVEWAIECQMDIIAERLGIDPVTLREKHLLKEGEPNIVGEITRSIGAKECLVEVAKAIKLGERPEEDDEVWKKGKGIALGNMYSTAAGMVASAEVVVQPDSTVEILSSAVEMGQGCQTVLSQIAACEFGLPLEKVRIVAPDTALTPFNYPTASSHTTYMVGKALRLACQDAKQQLFRLAAARLGVSPDRMEMKEGIVYVKDAPERSVCISELFASVATGIYLPGEVEIRGKGIVVPIMAPVDSNGLIPPEVAAKGGRRVTHRTHVAHAVEVAVNVLTGEVKILRFVGAYDIRPVNPKLSEGQMEGGAAMGISTTILEEMNFDGGILLNPNLVEYKLITSKEMPSNKNVSFMTIPAPGGDGPYEGVKGLGESVMVPTAPAIANAIHDAVGVRILELPITPEKLLQALRRKG